MNEFKGTPGPWKIMSDSPEGSEIESEHESPFWAFVSYDTPEAERTPNAQLIAAAPDLLHCQTMGAQINTPDFLEWIADRLVNVYGENPNVDFILSLRARASAARAALEKALGEKP